MNKRFYSIMIVFVFLCFISVSPLSAQNPQNQTLLESIANGNIQNVQASISSGININEKINQLGWTALHAAVMFKQIDIVKLLIQNHADVNAKDDSGQTPLFLAVESGQTDTVDLLIENNADVNITTNNGENALSQAQKIGLTSISNTLIQHNAVPPSPNTSNIGRGNRRGGPRGVVPNQNVQNVDMNTNMLNPEQTPTINMNAGIPVSFSASNINLDPNEVKARLQKYDGLEKAVQNVADGGRLVIRQWLRTDEDNRDTILARVRRQLEAEVELVKKTAEEEKVPQTTKAADELLSTKKTRFAVITRELRDQTEQNSRQNTRMTTSTSRRGSRTATNTTTRSATRSSRRGTNTAIEIPPVATEIKPENKYDAATQNEVDTWLNTNIETISSRISLMDTINNQIYSDLDSLKQIASQEKAEKTIAVIDGLILARQERYDEAKQELEKISQQQATQPATEMIETPGNRGQFMAPGGQNTAGRGRRGR